MALDNILIEKFDEEQAKALDNLCKKLSTTKANAFNFIHTIRVTVRALLLLVPNVQKIWFVVMMLIGNSEAISKVLELQQQQISLLAAKIAKLEGDNE